MRDNDTLDQVQTHAPMPSMHGSEYQGRGGCRVHVTATMASSSMPDMVQGLCPSSQPHDTPLKNAGSDFQLDKGMASEMQLFFGGPVADQIRHREV